MFEKELRDLSFVPRWGIVRTINRQAVSDHSYYVTVYTRSICRALNLSDADTVLAMTYALYHDAPERLTGDMPGPYKGQMTDPASLACMERSELGRFSFGGPLDDVTAASKDPTVATIVKAADYIDQCFYLSTEIQMGNGVNVTWILERSLQQACKLLDELGLDSSYLSKEVWSNRCFHPSFPGDDRDV